jgi:tetratricopeptide (TPR) repeat protein
MPDRIEPGSTVGRYEIVSSLSAGGMGELYHARDPELGRDLVVKLLPRRGVFHPEAVERFVREARAASALNHPNIVTVYEIGESPAGNFIAMELIEGRTLREMRSESPSMSAVARIGAQAARALAVAHQAGIIHRDIKPENVMLREDGYVKILDFGIAQLAQQHLSGDSETRITQPGVVVGTMRYMSPEQATGKVVTSASDIFSLGIVLYELAAGRHPFDSSSDMAVLSAIILREAIPPSRMNSRVPAVFDSLVMRMLAKNPDERPTAVEVDDTLDNILALQTASRHMSSGVVAHRGVIGREPELSALLDAFESSRHGRAFMVCVSGEPGIGKTTLVETFLRSLADSSAHFTAVGRCSERLAGAEAYLPLLDAIDDLMNEDGAGELRELLQSLAPSWAGMLAGSNASLEASPEGHAQSQERLKRELAAFFEQVCVRQPLVLLIEDIHWADVSTVDLVGYVLTRLRGSRLLGIATYRPAELQLSSHPFLALKLDLQTRGGAREIPLTFLTEEYVGKFISDRFPKNEFPSAFTELVHSRTEGSPLFVEDLLRYLKSRGAIVEADGSWTIPESLPDLEHDIPESMRSMVERKVNQLDPANRNLLAAASVQGHSFDSAIVARTLNLDTAEVEDRLETLDRIHGFVRRAGEREFPGGEISGRYRFVHVLYQNSLYASLSVSRRVSLSKAVGEALLELNGGEAAGSAAELGFLFETAREFERAASYFAAATEAALGIFAFDEASRLAKRAVGLVKRLPPTPQTLGLELGLQLMLGAAAGVAGGYAAPDCQAAMARARQLAEEIGSAPALSPALWGLHAYYLVSGEIRKALEMGRQSLAIAEQYPSDMGLMTAHTQMGITLRFVGEYSAAVEHFAKASEIYDPALQHEYTAAYRMDPGVFSKAETTRTLWAVGRVDDAIAMNEHSMALGRSSPDPRTVSFALLMSGVLYHLLRDPARTLRDAAEGIEITDEHQIVQERAWITTAHGWAMTQLGKVDEGVNEMAASLTMRRKMNAILDIPYALTQLAEGYVLQGKLDLARTTLLEALELRERNDDAWFEAEILRLLGEVTLASGGHVSKVEEHYRRSLEVAINQGTRSFELRTSVSLARLLSNTDRVAEAVELLTPVRQWFRSQKPTRDTDNADALLASLNTTATAQASAR